MGNLVVFTVPDGRYEPSLLPYLAAVLAYNLGVFVEVGGADAARLDRDWRRPDKCFGRG
ncbi:MAG: hypothetical protein AAGG47_16070 [Pseudomonadota bacterium]